MVNYEIKYTNRKTLAIYITKDARVEVRCNRRVRKADIERFICEKEKWINEKLELMRNRKSILLGNGSKILYLGKEYEIVVSESKEGMCGDKFFVHPSSDERYVYTVLEKFYKQKANEIIAERLHKYEQIMGLYSTKFGITSANTRWGSCSGKNSINFTWKLVMADIDVIDYVVVHEIAHIKEKNHGKNFWDLVGKYYPNYKSARVYLRNLSARIQQDNWI